MRFNSLQQISQKAKETIVRFPLPLIICLFAATALLWLVDNNEKNEWFKYVIKFLVTCTISLPAFIGLTLFCERYYIKKRTVFALHVMLLLFAFLYFYFLPYEFTEITAARHLLLLLAAHLAVSFAPFLVNAEMQGFWQFNKSLFLRFLTAGLYSFVLFAGLALAILAIDNLFEAAIRDEAYQRLFFIIAVIFNTWFFLSGVPRDFPGLEKENDYPNGLRIFTQFVLLPLVTIYLGILYVYELKILVTMNWPRGWVSYLVIGFSTAGILALLLVWPLRNDDRYKWVKTFTRLFYIALLPLIALLFLSIYIRVKEYGITENRYFIIVLAIWLLGNAIYFLFSRMKNIKVIPMSLFVVALLSGFGPWSAFEVSKSNQRSRLINLLSDQGMFKENRIVPAPIGNAMDKELRMKMGSLFDYLLSTHDIKIVQGIMDINLDSLRVKHGKYRLATMVMKSLNLEYEEGWRYDPEKSDKFQFTTETHDGLPLNVDGFQLFFKYEYYGSEREESKKVQLDSTASLMMDFISDKNVLSIVDADGVASELKMDALVSRIHKEYSITAFNLPETLMMATLQSENMECKLIFRSLYGTLSQKKELKEITSLQVDVLYRKK